MENATMVAIGTLQCNNTLCIVHLHWLWHLHLHCALCIVHLHCALCICVVHCALYIVHFPFALTFWHLHWHLHLLLLTCCLLFVVCCLLLLLLLQAGGCSRVSVMHGGFRSVVKCVQRHKQFRKQLGKVRLLAKTKQTQKTKNVFVNKSANVLVAGCVRSCNAYAMHSGIPSRHRRLAG